MRSRAGWLLATSVLAVLPGCTSPPATPGPSPSPAGPASGTSAPSTPTATPAASSPSVSTVPEPTTTNTLPPPPAPTRAAPSTAGDLTAGSLPVPDGWRRVVRKGGQEEGYLGNGTWVHARDPRYAAYDVITIGCAQVTRDDYRDPSSALEGTYDRKGRPGIGLVLEFRTGSEASAYFALYRSQAAACHGSSAPVQIQILPSSGGLVDRRTYPDGDWTEVGKLVDRRVTLIILSDPGHEISTGQAASLLAAIR